MFRLCGEKLARDLEECYSPCGCEASTRGLDSIENNETGEILEGNFRECLQCGSLWIE